MRPHFGFPLVAIVLVLAACSEGGGDQYIGEWFEVTGQAPPLTIEQTGDNFIVLSDANKLPGVLVNGALEISHPTQGNTRIIIEESSGNLLLLGNQYRKGQSFEEFWAIFKAAALAHDSKQVASMMEFPFRDRVHQIFDKAASVQLHSSLQLESSFNSIFTPDVLSAIQSDRYVFDTISNRIGEPELRPWLKVQEPSTPQPCAPCGEYIDTDRNHRAWRIYPSGLATFSWHKYNLPSHAMLWRTTGSGSIQVYQFDSLNAVFSKLMVPRIANMRDTSNQDTSAIRTMAVEVVEALEGELAELDFRSLGRSDESCLQIDNDILIQHPQCSYSRSDIQAGLRETARRFRKSLPSKIPLDLQFERKNGTYLLTGTHFREHIGSDLLYRAMNPHKFAH